MYGKRQQTTIPSAARRKIAAFALALLGSLSRTVSADAQCRTDPAQDAVAGELAAEANKARTWRYVWTTLNGGSMVLSLAAIPILPKSARPDLVLGAATSALSGAVTWFWPLDVEDDAQVAERTRCWSPNERGPELLRLRRHSAADEAERIRWPWHVGNLVTSLIPGAILWFGFHEHVNGILSAAGSFASGEVELLTQPTRLADEPAPPGLSVSGHVSGDAALLTLKKSW
jgi:hypothetical protein